MKEKLSSNFKNLTAQLKTPVVASKSPIALAILWSEKVIFQQKSLKRLNSEGNVFNTLAAQQKRQFLSNLYMLLKFWPRLDYYISQITEKNIPQRKKKLRLLIALTLARLQNSKSTDSQIIDGSLKALKELNLMPYKPFFYAISQKIKRNLNEFEKYTLTAEAKHLFPNWLYEFLKENLGEHRAVQISTQSLEKNSLWIRTVNSFISKNEYKKILMNKNIEFFDPESETTPNALKIISQCACEDLPLWKEGAIVTQDLSSQRTLHFFNLKKEENVSILEMCAAPGGKALYLLQEYPKVMLDCLEKDPIRFNALNNRLLGFKDRVTTYLANALEWKGHSDKKTYDYILLDAPCSGCGVFSRHPDAKWLKKPEDFLALEILQRQLLNTAWSWLKEGGTLIYSTCSILPQENILQVRQFQKTHAKATFINPENFKGLMHELKSSAKKDFFEIYPEGIQIFPSTEHGDGFFYACLKKLK